jgi:hypothetical protein
VSQPAGAAWHTLDATTAFNRLQNGRSAIASWSRVGSSLRSSRDVTERTRLCFESERQLRDIESLYRADEVLHRSLRVDDVLQALVDLARDIMRANKSSVLIWDADHR